MPSPVGHALGGLIVGLLALPHPRTLAPPHLRTPALSHPRTLGALALVACAPDLDFLWGRHSAETHSVGLAVLAGLLALAGTKGRNPRWALAVALAWSSHVLFDSLGSDDTAPIGVMALWPFTDAYYSADAFVFDAISRRYWLPGFWTHNALAVVREVLLLAPVALGLAWARCRKADRP